MLRSREEMPDGRHGSPESAERQPMDRAGSKRLGVLVGDSDPIVEFDLQRFLPSHVSFHVGRLDMPPDAGLAASRSSQMMCDSAPHAARKVAVAEVDFFAFACTSASFLHGEGWDRRVARSITDATGVPATTTATAVADALEAIGARRVFMATPYSRDVNAREVAFLRRRGIEVAGQLGFDCSKSRDVSRVPVDRIRDRLLARGARISEAGALFVSCTMLRAMEIAEGLEEELGVPVVTSNTATMWAMLRAIGESGTHRRRETLFAST